MNAAAYLENVVFEFTRLRELADAAIRQLPDDELFRVPSAEANSVGVIMKHMAGNMLSRWTDFLTTDGEKPDRNRDEEFERSVQDTPARAREAWSRGWDVLFRTLSTLTPEDLDATVRIRGERFTAVQAINRQLTHYAAHVGQIVYVAKLFCGPDWQSLSIPRGQSRRFNENPARYL